MPLLGAMFVNLFAGLTAWLTAYVSRKVAFGLAAVAAYSTITIALYVLFRGTLSALAGYSTGIPSMFIEGARIGFPPAAPFCLSTYITLWTACTVYTWQRDLLHLVVKA